MSKLVATFLVLVAVAASQRSELPGELIYNKTFDNGDRIYIKIRAQHGSVNGIVEYLDESRVPINFVDYYVSDNTTDFTERLFDDTEQNHDNRKDRQKRQSDIPQLTLIQEIPQGGLPRF